MLSHCVLWYKVKTVVISTFIRLAPGIVLASPGYIMQKGSLKNRFLTGQRPVAGLIVLLTPLYYIIPWQDLSTVSAVLGIPFLLLYTIVLPGIIIRDRIIPDKTDFLANITAAAAFGLALFLGLAFAAVLGKLSLGTLTSALPAVMILVAAWGFLDHPSPSREEPKVMSRGDRLLIGMFAVLLVAVFVLVLRSGPPIGFTSDALDHIAYVTEIRDTGELFPRTAFYADPGANGEDLRKGLLHVFYGYSAGYLGLAPLAFLTAINAVFAVLLLLCVYSTGILFFGDRKIAVLSAALFLIALDEGFGGTMIRQSFYSHRFGTLFFLYVLAFGLSFLTTGNKRDLIPAAIFGFAAAATHVFFGILVGLAGVTILIWKVCFPQNNGRTHFQRVLLLGAIVVLGMLPYGLFRYLTAFPRANELHGEVQGVVFITQHLYIADPLQVYKWFGPVGIVSLIAIIPLWISRKRHAFLGYAFAASLTVILVLFNPVLLPPVRNAMTYLIARLNNLCPFYFVAAYFLLSFSSLKSDKRLLRPFTWGLAFVAIIAVILGLKPVFGKNTFTPSVIQSERANSYLLWKDDLAALTPMDGDKWVIASDPLTAYSVTAFTPNHVVCTFDQHAPPNDVHLEERMRSARDIMSPYTSVAHAAKLLETNRGTHVVINNRFPRGLRLEYWAMTADMFPSIRAKFDSRPDIFEPISDDEAFVVYRWTGIQGGEAESFDRPFVLDSLPHDFESIGLAAGKATLEGIRLNGATLEEGDPLGIELVWSGSSEYHFRNYMVAVRFDHASPQLPFAGKPFPKIMRKFKEKFTGRRYRFSEYHKIRNGFLSPDTWNAGDFVLDETSLRIPSNAAPGEYDVYVKLLEMKHQPTHWLRDYFFDDDSYQGIHAARITIK